MALWSESKGTGVKFGNGTLCHVVKLITIERKLVVSQNRASGTFRLSVRAPVPETRPFIVRIVCVSGTEGRRRMSVVPACSAWSYGRRSSFQVVPKYKLKVKNGIPEN